MLCPYCFNKDSKVIDKRNAEGIIRRRRECLKCTKRFNTKESVEKAELRVVKKDGRREDFDRDKIKKGILRACEKRPVGDEVIEKMVGKIEERVRRNVSDVKTDFIGELVAKELKKAELAIKYNLNYVQDEDIDFEQNVDEK